MIAVVISDLDEDELRPLLARRLGRFAAGGRPPPRALPLRRPPRPRLDVERQDGAGPGLHLRCRCRS